MALYENPFDQETVFADVQEYPGGPTVVLGAHETIELENPPPANCPLVLVSSQASGRPALTPIPVVAAPGEVPEPAESHEAEKG